MLEKITLQLAFTIVGSENAWNQTVRGRVLAREEIGYDPCNGRTLLPAGTRLTDDDIWTLYFAEVDEIILMNSPAETARARREF